MYIFHKELTQIKKNIIGICISCLFCQYANATSLIKDYTSYEDAGSPCYTDNNEWILAIYESYCYASYEIFEYGNSIEASCTEDQLPEENVNICSYNAVTNISDDTPYGFIMVCIKESEYNNIYDNNEDKWKIFFPKLTERPDYLNSDISFINDYFYTDEFNTKKCISYAEDCNRNYYYDESELTCLNCPNDGFSDGGSKSFITDCYLPPRIQGKDESGEFEIGDDQCYNL